MSFNETAERQIAETIGRWKRQLAAAVSEGSNSDTRRLSNWLFGAEIVLSQMGLDELARAAGATQRDSGT
jgi:hypothetical protein